MRTLSGLLLIVAVMFLMAAAGYLPGVAHAQEKQISGDRPRHGPVVITNRTKQQFTLDEIQVVGADGKTSRMTKLTVNMGVHNRLLANGKEVHARGIEYKLLTEEGWTIWKTVEADFDKDGSLRILVTDDTLKKHRQIIKDDLPRRITVMDKHISGAEHLLADNEAKLLRAELDYLNAVYRMAGVVAATLRVATIKNDIINIRHRLQTWRDERDGMQLQLRKFQER